jgi:hypothetical protein
MLHTKVFAFTGFMGLASATPFIYDGRAPFNYTSEDLNNSLDPYLSYVLSILPHTPIAPQSGEGSNNASFVWLYPSSLYVQLNPSYFSVYPIPWVLRHSYPSVDA